ELRFGFDDCRRVPLPGLPSSTARQRQDLVRTWFKDARAKSFTALGKSSASRVFGRGSRLKAELRTGGTQARPSCGGEADLRAFESLASPYRSPAGCALGVYE